MQYVHNTVHDHSIKVRFFTSEREQTPHALVGFGAVDRDANGVSSVWYVDSILREECIQVRLIVLAIVRKDAD